MKYYAAWYVEAGNSTGQGYISKHVIDNYSMEKFPIRQGLQGIYSWIAKTVKIYKATLYDKKIKAVYVVCSRSNFGFIRDIPVYLLQYLGTPLFIHIHGSDIEILCKKWFIGRLTISLLGKQTVIVPTVFLCKKLKNLGFEKVIVCENFSKANVNINNVDIASEKLSNFQILWNSNIMASKGIFNLLAAIREINNECGDRIHINVAGSPISDELMSKKQCVEALQAYQNNSWLSVLGKRESFEIRKLLHITDLVCLPSIYKSECQPLALIDAMCSACSVMISDTVALKETVGNYPAYIVRQPDIEGIKEILQKILSERTEKDHNYLFSEIARKRFSKNKFMHTIDSVLSSNLS